MEENKKKWTPWRPIETAPKDGTIIRLAYIGKKGDVQECHAAVYTDVGGDEFVEHPWRFLDFEDDNDTAFVNGWHKNCPTHWRPLEDDFEADLYEAAVLQQECGLPVAELFYDEEAVEGWAWSHPDGRVWSVIGSHNELPPFHPVMDAALAKARGEN
jgi:hypothetical protein